MAEVKKGKKIAPSVSPTPDASSSPKAKVKTVTKPVSTLKSAAKKKTTAKKTDALKQFVKKTDKGTGAEKIAISVNRELKRALPPVAPAPMVSTKKKETRALTAPFVTELSLLSPFRFPIDYDKLAKQTARYAGMAFLTLGAAFGMYHATQLEVVDPSVGMVAETVATDVNVLDPIVNTATGTLESATTPLLNTKPPVTMSVDGEQPLKGLVRIKYQVQSATKVDALVFYKDEQKYITLGSATRVSGSGDYWYFDWHTDNYDDGEYKLRALVTNQYGKYEEAGSTYVTVLNTVPPSTATSPSTTGTQSTTTTSTASETTIPTLTTPKVALIIDEKSPVSGGVKLIVRPTGFVPLDVKLYSYEVSTNKNIFIGNALIRSNTEWAFDWDSTKFANGTYKIYAAATVATTQYKSDSMYVDVLNAVETPDDVVTTTTALVDTIASTSAEIVEEVTTTAPLLYIPEQSPISGGTDVNVRTSDATSVEIYAIPAQSQIQKFIGLASKRDSETWRYVWDTKSIPNGEYKVFARVKANTGQRDTDGLTIKILNDTETVVATPEEEARIEEVKAVEQKVALVEQTLMPAIAEPVTEELPEDADEDTVVSYETDKLLASFSDELNTEVNLLSVALRSGDPTQIEQARQRMQALKERILSSAASQDDLEPIIEKINAKIDEAIAAIEKETERREEIIKERVGDEVFKDSDKDGISDYDEVNIYSTDPFNVDTDGDGFIDGNEILSGYDPLNAAAEAAVAFESPKDTGVVREDILSVDDIVTISTDPDDQAEDGVRGQAIISGRGLPNSFITLYIFSAPTIVTVKTDDAGGWTYTFDKELPDGEHEIYVGITDNAGRIVAKSNPLPFIKTAEAFTPVAANEAAVPQAAPAESQTLFSSNVILLVLSLMVVAIGLVLLLLGMHINARPKLIPKQA